MSVTHDITSFENKTNHYENSQGIVYCPIRFRHQLPWVKLLKELNRHNFDIIKR